MKKRHSSIPPFQSISENEVSNASLCSVGREPKSYPVVYVWLSHASAPKHSRPVYALTDSLFILDKTLDSKCDFFKFKFVCVSYERFQQVMSRKLTYFKVQGYNLFKVIDLPVVFSRPDIPFDRNRILRSDSFAILLHLKEIT